MSARLILRPRGESAACGFHPWIYHADVARIDGTPNLGESMQVVDAKEQRVLGHAFYEGGTGLVAKVYSWSASEVFSASWLRGRIEAALNIRRSLGYRLDQAFRVVNSEGDQVPGLTLDWYAGLAVAQITSAGLWQHQVFLVDVLKDLLSPKALVLQGNSFDSPAICVGDIPAEGFAFMLADLPYRWLPGAQKTGAFLDQVRNQHRVAVLAKDRVVWDLYCHQGGFALRCAMGGARHVLAVDRSAQALASASEAARSLGLSGIEWLQADVADVYAKAKDYPKPDIIILDPPKLVASKASKAAGLRHYFRLNELALAQLGPGGMLVSFSCSGRVSLSEWLDLITSVLRRNKRQARIHEILGPGPDHPYNPHLPESQYLKGVLLTLSS